MFHYLQRTTLVERWHSTMPDQQTDQVVAQLHVSALLVFDFDGVLADSVEVKTEAFAELYRPYGEEVVAQVIRHHRQHGGVSRYEKFRHYHLNFLGKKIDAAMTKDLADRFSRLVIDKVVASPEIAGARQFLETYCVDGRRCAINSATPDSELEAIVSRRNLRHFFAAVCGSDRTKSENLEFLLTATETRPEQCVFLAMPRPTSMPLVLAGCHSLGSDRRLPAFVMNGARHFLYTPISCR